MSAKILGIVAGNILAVTSLSLTPIFIMAAYMQISAPNVTKIERYVIFSVCASPPLITAAAGIGMIYRKSNLLCAVGIPALTLGGLSACLALNDYRRKFNQS